MNGRSFCTRSGRVGGIFLIAAAHRLTVFEQHRRPHTEIGVRRITGLRCRFGRFDQTRIRLRQDINARGENMVRKLETSLFHWAG